MLALPACRSRPRAGGRIVHRDGRSLPADIERRTNQAALPLVEAVGPDRTARLTDLLKPVRRALLEGAFARLRAVETIVSMEINAITFVVTDMAASVGFYTDLDGEIVYGGAGAPFTSLSFGSNFVNLQRTGRYPDFSGVG